MGALRTGTAARVVTRRTYATGATGPKSGSDLPWLLASATFTIPAAYYLYKSGPPETEHGGGPHRPVVSDHGTVPSDEKEDDVAEKAQEDAAPAEQAAEQPADTAEEGEKPSEYDPGKAQRAPKGPGEFSGATSAKQQGVSNTETKHPELDAPGKSVKGEGETESAKLKGTVSTERPQ